MTNSQRLAIVRTCLLRWLQQNDENAAGAETILRESILIRNEFYCGRQFHTAHHHAIWFIEEDQLKIYDADRQILAVFTGDEIDAEPEATILKLPRPDESDESDDIRRAA